LRGGREGEEGEEERKGGGWRENQEGRLDWEREGNGEEVMEREEHGGRDILLQARGSGI
jgi:hypothetical protein